MTNHDERSVRESTWGEYWIAASDSEPGFWTDDGTDIRKAQENGRQVLEALDGGRIEGVTGSAHLADVMNLTGRVQELESCMTSVLDAFKDLGDLARKIFEQQYKYDQGGQR